MESKLKMRKLCLSTKFMLFLIQMFLIELIFTKKGTESKTTSIKFEDYHKEISSKGVNENTKNNKKGINLVYFSPWNKEGEAYVTKYAGKLDIISPVWFDLKPENLQGKYNTNVI